MQWKLKLMIVDLLLLNFLNNQDRYCYNAFKLIYNIINSWNQHKKCIILFYDVNFEELNVIFNMSILTNQKIIVYSTASSWRFKININKFEISKSKKFAKALQKQFIVYVFVVANVTTTFKNKSKSSEFFENYLYLKKMFDNKLTKMLFEQSYKNHIINLMKNKKFSYMLLYNLFQIELTKLRRYLNNILIKKWIKLSISLASVSIFFVFKKDEKLRLYMNYRNLNTIIIKHRHLLSFIIETLNRLCDVKRFIKLNLKNAYHRIRIKKNDKWKTTFRTRYDHFKY